MDAIHQGQLEGKHSDRPGKFCASPHCAVLRRDAAVADQASKKTHRNLHAILTKMLSYELDLELIPSNPVKRGTAPKLEKTEKPILTEIQLNALFGLVPIHYKAFFMTLAMTGIRTGEALGLKWADVDFAERDIHVRRAIYRGKETTP